MVLSAAVLLVCTSGLAATARLHAACLALEEEMFAERQLEHLVDRASLAAGSGPLRPPALTSLDASNAVFGADLDGNGTVDSSGSETSALEVRRSGNEARIRVRVGKQTMTVLVLPETEATIEGLDREGRGATASTATLLELELRPRADVDAARRLLFALPARRSW